MVRLQQLYLVMPLISLAPSSRAFVPMAPLPLPERIRWPLRKEVEAARMARLGSGSRRWGPRHLLASAQHDVKDTRSIISEMKNWARVITAETYTNQRSLQYLVSSGSSIPEVLFDFWKAISHVIDEHRATGEDRSLRKLIMFVAPYCEELKDYQTMEHVHQLLQQSATVGDCGDFGTDITHSHYHPNYGYRPRPKEMRMASCHSPHPAFGIEVLYSAGGLKNLVSMRSAPWIQGTGATAHPRPRPRAKVDVTPREGRFERARRKRDGWAANARSALENVYYNTPASYGAEDAVAGSSSRPYSLAGRGVPESSQEIMEITQAWLRGALKDAAESDAVAAKLVNINKNKARSVHRTSPSSNTSSSNLYSTTYPSSATSIGDRPSEKLTSALPEAGPSFPGTVESTGPGTSGDPAEKNSLASGFQEKAEAGQRVARRAGPRQEVFAHASEEYLPVRGEVWRDEVVKGKEEVEDAKALSCKGDAGGAELLPGKELVKRMRNISQYIVARSKTAEEAFGDVWEVICEMAERATARGCSVPTEDYSSRSSPCYGALFVTPDFATYSAEAFSRFQEILNRGLRHLPMEHDISVEAFHPEVVSETTPLDHRFTRSPFPTLHVCYHGLRARHSPLYPKAPIKAVGGTSSSSNSGSRMHGDSKKRRN